MREARRDANLHHLLVDPERPRQRAHERRHHNLGRGDVRPGHHEREFIAVETATERAQRQNIFDTPREGFEKLVANAVAERIVDVLQAVEIEERQRQHCALRTACQRAVDQFDHLAMVVQAGEHVLVRQRPSELLALAEIAHRAPHQPQRNAGKADQEHAGQPKQRPELTQRIAHRAIRFPGEPADDAAIPTQHGLDLAVAGDRLGFETQVLEAGGPLYALDMAGVERGEVGAGATNVLDGAQQRGAPLLALAVVRLADQSVADDDREERGADHEQGERRHQTWRPQPASWRCNTHTKTARPAERKLPRMEPRG